MYHRVDNTHEYAFENIELNPCDGLDKRRVISCCETRQRRPPQGFEAITKLQKLSIKPDRHTGATIKLAGRPANRRIFLAFTSNHVATRGCSRCIYSRVRVSPTRGKNCTAILQRHSKCRCKTSTPVRLPRAPLPPYPHFFSPFLLLPRRNSFVPREYESVSWNDEGEFALNHIFYIVFLRSVGVLNIARRRRRDRSRSSVRLAKSYSDLSEKYCSAMPLIVATFYSYTAE